MPYKLREVSRGNYDDRGYSNEETIAHLMLERPEEINATLTYTYGMDDDRFPLTMLTEGQGSAGVKDISTVTWTWKTMGRGKFNSRLIAATGNGAGGSLIEATFEDHWLIEQYGVMAPDGQTGLRIMKDLGETTKGYKYLLKLTTPDPTAIIDMSAYVGMYFSMTAPTITESYSKGNRSNVMGPGKMMGQLEFHRYSKEIGGDLSNRVVTYEFKTAGGGTTNLWINEEMRQFDITMRIMEEERLWIAEYNRATDGEVHFFDIDNGKPIYSTSGMFEIARESNYDTYGEKLTLAKINRTVCDVLDKDTDTGTMEVTLFCGKGFFQDFDQAIRDEVTAKGYTDALGFKEISDFEGGLSYGKYFKRYVTPDGHVITLKHLNFLDSGTMAETAKMNGLVHPRTGLPLMSHQAIMVDLSMYGGERNVRKIRMKNQVYKTGVIKGLTDIPASWGAVPQNILSQEIDASRYEIKTSSGLQVNNNKRMFMLKCVL